MESMDNVRERFEALEQRTEQLRHETQALKAHTYKVERQLRWWRGIACGVVLLGLLSPVLPSGRAADTPLEGLAGVIATLQDKFTTLQHKLAVFTFDAKTNEVVITGANLRIVNGLGATETTNGLGNLIVGYNESRQFDLPDIRTGSHNVVVGKEHNFSSFGGVVVGLRNEISGDFSSVSGGSDNTASGNFSSVSGGSHNTASGVLSSVSGGAGNTASGLFSSVSGGEANTASGNGSSVSGGAINTASVVVSSVSGGEFNSANGFGSSVSGGVNNTASANFSSVSGGENNTARGDSSSVSGGANRTAPGVADWAAGPLFADN